MYTRDKWHLRLKLKKAKHTEPETRAKYIYLIYILYLAFGTHIYWRDIAQKWTEVSESKQSKEPKYSRNRQHQRKYGIFNAPQIEGSSRRHLWLNNCGDQTRICLLALEYPLQCPTLHVRAYHCITLDIPRYLCCVIFRHDLFRPLFHLLKSLPVLLGSDYPLITLDTLEHRALFQSRFPAQGCLDSSS